MTEVIIQIKEQSELEKLYSLLDQFKFEYKTTLKLSRKRKDKKADEVFQKIRNGALRIPNFEEFMKEFEEHRHYSTIEGRD